MFNAPRTDTLSTSSARRDFFLPLGLNFHVLETGMAGRDMGRRENGRRVPSVVCYECRSLEDVKL